MPLRKFAFFTTAGVTFVIEDRDLLSAAKRFIRQTNREQDPVACVEFSCLVKPSDDDAPYKIVAVRNTGETPSEHKP